MQLYKFTDQYQRALSLIEEAEEDLTEEHWGLLTELEGAFNDKIESVAKFIKSLLGDLEIIKAERQRLSSREKTLGNKVDWLKRYLQHAMQAAGKDKIKGELLSVNLQASPLSCRVIDESAVPPRFIREVTLLAEMVPDELLAQATARKLDSKGMIKWFKATGESLPGVEIDVDKRHIVIR